MIGFKVAVASIQCHLYQCVNFVVNTTDLNEKLLKDFCLADCTDRKKITLS